MGWLWMAVFWGLITWAVVTVVRRHSSSDAGSASIDPDPLTILERRYAAGRDLTGGVRRTSKAAHSAIAPFLGPGVRCPRTNLVYTGIVEAP